MKTADDLLLDLLRASMRRDRAGYSAALAELSKLAETPAPLPHALTTANRFIESVDDATHPTSGGR